MNLTPANNTAALLRSGAMPLLEHIEMEDSASPRNRNQRATHLANRKSLAPLTRKHATLQSNIDSLKKANGRGNSHFQIQQVARRNTVDAGQLEM